jgi:outer membrane receptor for ferrienterochelin and colicins
VKYLIILLFLILTTYKIKAQNNNDSIKKELKEIVISGNITGIKKSESIIPVENISCTHLQKNPTPSLFESLSIINGVKPQINCNVCNTGDIHINGMEGPYTLVLIDGMPIVSGLSSVYGLSGIPTSLIERVEIIKGPASSLYGSDAMGGLINVITKKPTKSPKFSLENMNTNWLEFNTDIGFKGIIKEKTTILGGLNLFNYNEKIDNNKDGFTDIPVQNRMSLFTKFQFKQKEKNATEFGLRGVIENRWGGQINWSEPWAGSDSIYGESIKTRRLELIMKHQLIKKKKVIFQGSFNTHNQFSFYGTTPYNAIQNTLFLQLFDTKIIQEKNSILYGISYKYISYDDNSPSTMDSTGKINKPAITKLPGLFGQYTFQFNTIISSLIGYRYDYEENHKHIHSPRIGFKFKINQKQSLRYNYGTGFRIVNLFTEDHAALSGARKTIITENLNPERSYNHTLHYTFNDSILNEPINIETSLFYTYFNNKIIGDFDSNPKEIRYKNLDGFAISKGFSINIDYNYKEKIKITLGTTLMEVYSVSEKIKQIQFHAPKYSGTFTFSYIFNKNTFDFTGNWNGPMRLPILPNDFRPEYSPWFCIINLQHTYTKNKISIQSGIKNILNFIPQDPIMRPFDPFDKQTNNPITNPNNYTFDPSYNYASLQGVRLFLGLKYRID